MLFIVLRLYLCDLDLTFMVYTLTGSVNPYNGIFLLSLKRKNYNFGYKKGWVTKYTSRFRICEVVLLERLENHDILWYVQKTRSQGRRE